jgi:hypothetical protein
MDLGYRYTLRLLEHRDAGLARTTRHQSRRRRVATMIPHRLSVNLKYKPNVIINTNKFFLIASGVVLLYCTLDQTLSFVVVTACLRQSD